MTKNRNSCKRQGIDIMIRDAANGIGDCDNGLLNKHRRNKFCNEQHLKKDKDGNYLLPDGSSISGSGGESNIAWLPNVSDDGELSWSQSNTATAPTTQNITGPAGKDAVDFYQSAVAQGFEGTYEEWVKTLFYKTTARCSGNFKTISLPASTASYSIPTPEVVDGDANMISGRKFVAPVSGLYLLNTFGGALQSSARTYTCIVKNNDDLTTFALFNKYGVSCAGMEIGRNIPTVTALTWLNKGEYLTYRISCSVEQSSLDANDSKHGFEFALISTSCAGENSGIDIPPGGASGQVLTKISDDDYDADWVDPVSVDSYTKSELDAKFDEIKEELKDKLNFSNLRAGENIYIHKTDKIVTISMSATPPTLETLPRYGVRVADDESNPTMERLYNAVDMVANVGTFLTDNPRNDFDNVYPFNAIKEETINGRVMMRIPKFYVRREHYEEDGVWYREWAICKEKYDITYVPHEMFLKGNVAYTGANPESDYNDYMWVAKYETSSNNQSIGGATVQVNQTRATFRTNAKAIGNGWTVMDIATWSGLWTLFHIVFATRDSQSIMRGNYSGAVKSTGSTDGKVASCVQMSNTAMDFYGIENLYSNTWTFVDGININGQQLYVSTRISDFADNTNTDYRQVGYVKSAADGYITQLGYDINNKFAEFPIIADGSSTTYYCNYYWQNPAWRILCVGGSWGDTTNYGVTAWSSNSESSHSATSIGSRLAYRSF